MRQIEEIKKTSGFKIIEQQPIGIIGMLTYNHKDYYVIFTWDNGWEHASISHRAYTPNWDVMCMLKDILWEDEEVVMQLHPKKSEYINLAHTCLHLWKPIGKDIPTPPKELVL